MQTRLRRRQADDVLTRGKDEKTEIATVRDDLAGGWLGSAEEQAGAGPGRAPRG